MEYISGKEGGKTFSHGRSSIAYQEFARAIQKRLEAKLRTDILEIEVRIPLDLYAPPGTIEVVITSEVGGIRAGVIARHSLCIYRDGADYRDFVAGIMLGMALHEWSLLILK